MQEILQFYKQRINNLDFNLNIKGLKGSIYSFYATTFIEKYNEDNLLFILKNKEEAEYFLNDLNKISPKKDSIYFFPSSYKRYDLTDIDNVNLLQRTEVLNKMHKGESITIVTYPDAIFEKILSKENLEKNLLEIKKGGEYSLDFITEMLYEYEFNFTDFVSEPGQFSIRGSIIDVFSYSNESPYRIDFFGNEVDSIRTFNIETQLSIKNYAEIEIIPNIQKKENSGTGRISLFQFLPKGFKTFFTDLEFIKENLKSIKKKIEGLELLNFQDYFINKEELEEGILKNNFIEINSNKVKNYSQEIEIKSKPQPIFNKNFDLLKRYLKENQNNKIENFIFFSDEKQKIRFENIFKDLDDSIKFNSQVLPISEGFIDLDNKIACYTDHQIFERYHKAKTKKNRFKSQALTIKELTDLKKGDYVTHIDHGVGKFSGLQKIELAGKFKEAIKIEYAGNDIVYVNIHSLHKIAKFNSSDGIIPKIHKLGSNVWSNLKNKTKKRVKEIAYDLIKLYAQRKTKKGYSFPPDNYLQYELEASFMYEDTEDQAKASQDVKNDMEKETPMDRLVCGDVGFGKTEVAIRSAFKAMADGKQVAVLVPTTILAFQHYNTFKKRLEDFGVSIDYLNRFRTTKQKNEILKNLENGKIDIIIGTHQIVNDKIKYKDLGLLIIDEEQKFGVAIKDKLKTLKVNLDTLTLTATPIPRTLQFSLMSARDLSVINTPPPNRYPIENQIIRFNHDIIKDAILHEIERGGQIYFIHNRVQNIEDVANIIQKLVPNIRIAIGHGQMDGKKLENTLLNFINKEYDLLLATTIIENGVDVPNANTIFINDANRFGLSDLHQMRGRVGRSNKKAYCYFITPPYKEMTTEARKRLQALEIFSDLGQGFNIAMKDLEIRGAGDLLGGDQSGFITDIGFETYEKILAEAIIELKDTEEFKDIIDEENNASLLKMTRDIYLDTDYEAFFPESYISSSSEKIILYRELSKIDNDEDLEIFKNKIKDRFGIFPEEVINLFKIVKIKWFAQKINIDRLIIKENRVRAYFSSNNNNQDFSKILNFISQNPNICETKVDKGNTILTIKHISSLDKIVEVFYRLV